MKQKYLDYLESNFELDFNEIKNKTIAITGASGSLGRETSLYLASLSLIKELILINTNLERLNKLKEEILTINPNIKVITIPCDFVSKDDVNNLINLLTTKYIIDIFINVSGIYHLPLKMYLDNKIERTFLINHLAPNYIIKNLLNYNKDIKIVYTCSISYKYFKLDINDLMSLKKNNLTKRYANSKRCMMIYSLNLKINTNYKIILTHPGVSSTSLFDKRRGGYKSKLFYKLIVPLMNKIFMEKDKAALSIVEGAIMSNYDNSYFLGPRGLFKAYGYPKVSKLSKKLFDKEIMNKVVEESDKLMDEYFK